MKRVVYISESRLEPSEQEQSTAQIVAAAQIRNATLSLTGALLFTGIHFAQIFEGPKGSVELLLSSLQSDVRHANMKIVERSPITERKFPDWQMAYQGPSQFVSRHVVQLLHTTSQSEQRRVVEWLTVLAQEFTQMRVDNKAT